MDTEHHHAGLSSQQWQQLGDIAQCLLRSAPCGIGHEVDGWAIYLQCKPTLDHSTAPLGYSIKSLDIRITVTPNP